MTDFPRIITLLRKERGISQKQAAAELGISQALLSHYEKGIRECGLDFMVRIADFYDVSCDYLLGRSPERTGATLSVEDIPDDDTAKDNVLKGSILPILNKKLIVNTLNMLFDMLLKVNDKQLTQEVSYFLSLAVYRIFRVFYSANPKNEQKLFTINHEAAKAKALAEMVISETASAMRAKELASADANADVFAMSTESLSKDYPLFTSSLMNIISNCENNISGNN